MPLSKIFLLDFGTVLTVWYFLFLILSWRCELALLPHLKCSRSWIRVLIGSNQRL